MSSEESFEQNLNQLEESVRNLENGNLPLKETLEIFEKGLELSKKCTDELSKAELKIEKLIAKGGAVESVPFEVAE